jgi:hypothetical protein
MLKHNLQIEEEAFKMVLKDKSLTYNVITPPCWLKCSVDGGQHTKDNSLRFWRLSLKKSYSKFNLQESYLTNFHKVWFHALRWCIVIT